MTTTFCSRAPPNMAGAKASEIPVVTKMFAIFPNLESLIVIIIVIIKLSIFVFHGEDALMRLYFI